MKLKEQTIIHEKIKCYLKNFFVNKKKKKMFSLMKSIGNFIAQFSNLSNLCTLLLFNTAIQNKVTINLIYVPLQIQLNSAVFLA